MKKSTSILTAPWNIGPACVGAFASLCQFIFKNAYPRGVNPGVGGRGWAVLELTDA